MRPEILAREAFLWARGLALKGRRFQCPCCGAGIRTFIHARAFARARAAGYCPRCNSKARHRRVWIFLIERSDLGKRPLDLLHVAPKYCLYRAVRRMPDVDYESIDLRPGPEVTRLADLTALPCESERFHAIICVHVLEHIDDDLAAMQELYRVLRPGGWALVNVPCRLDRATYEDATIISPEERRKAFGEADHRRMYGADIVTRLESVGFRVEVDVGSDVSPDLVARHGLTTDEHLFWCHRPKHGGAR